MAEIFSTPGRGRSTPIALNDITSQEGVWYIEWDDDEKEKEQKKYLVGLGVNYYIKINDNEYELIDEGGGSLHLDGTAFADIRKPETKDTVYVALTTIVTDDYELEHFDFSVYFEPVTLASGGESVKFVEGSLNGSLVSNTCTKYKFKDGITELKNRSTTCYLFNKNTIIQEIIIPNTCTSIANDYFNGCTNLTTITDCSGVTSVGDAAFQNCNKLTNVSFSEDGVYVGTSAFYMSNGQGCTFTSIGGKILFYNTSQHKSTNAFNGCKSLKYIDINSTTSICSQAFFGCTSLYSDNEGSNTLNVNSALSIAQKAFYGCTSLTRVSATKATTLGDSVFQGCTKLNQVTLDSATSLSNNLFNGCTSLQTVNAKAATKLGTGVFTGCNYLDTLHLDSLPTLSAGYFSSVQKSKLRMVYLNSLGTVANELFNGFTNLTTININSATSIGLNAFYGCIKLSSVKADTATTVGDSAFYNCISLTTISLPKATSIGGNTFQYCTKLNSVSLPLTTTLDFYVFDGCSALTTISLPKVTSVGNRAFNNCTKLNSVSLPLAETFENYSFQGCTALVNIELPKASSLSGYNFMNCTGLKTVKISEATSIGDEVFVNCNSLETINAEKLTSIGNGAIPSSQSYKELYLNSWNLGDTPFTKEILTAINLEHINLNSMQHIGAQAFYRYEYLETAICGGAISVREKAFYGDYELTEVDISSAETIGSIEETDPAGETFRGCTKLENVKTSSSLKHIRKYSFYNCNALKDTNLVLSGVTDIYERAFENCTSLENLSIPNATVIGEWAFYDCTGLETIDISGATIICQGAFQNCTSLNTITITSGVKVVPLASQTLKFGTIKGYLYSCSWYDNPCRIYRGDVEVGDLSTEQLSITDTVTGATFTRTAQDATFTVTWTE